VAAFYKLASYVLFWLALPFLLTHPKLREGFLERLGVYRRTLASRAGPRIWLHGASAGDLLALEPILERLRARLPDCTLIVSTLTNSGKLMARERLRQADVLIYLPYDLAGAVRRAMRALRPDLLILEYTEIWPNLIWAAKRSGSLVALTNGRFSTKTLQSYRLLFTLIGNPLKLIDLFLMRGEDEAERALVLGAPLERVWVTGNTKFDARRASSLAFEGPHSDLRASIGETEPLLIAGSTHEGEEEFLLAALQKLRADSPMLRLVLAPRYIERAGRLLSLAREWGFSARLRSQGPLPPKPPTDVVVLDTIGELGQAYRLATLVFVGGSFTARGGQNILEPAAAGKPVLFGPNMENFADSVQVLMGRGGIQVKDAEQLERVLHELLAKPELIAELGSMAQAAVTTARGASERDVDHLVKLLKAGGRDA
jgi:3-deoxy-D-manno-octulosonic-acid transferase